MLCHALVNKLLVKLLAYSGVLKEKRPLDAKKNYCKLQNCNVHRGNSKKQRVSVFCRFLITNELI